MRSARGGHVAPAAVRRARRRHGIGCVRHRNRSGDALRPRAAPGGRQRRGQRRAHRREAGDREAAPPHRRGLRRDGRHRGPDERRLGARRGAHANRLLAPLGRRRGGDLPVRRVGCGHRAARTVRGHRGAAAGARLDHASWRALAARTRRCAAVRAASAAEQAPRSNCPARRCRPGNHAPSERAPARAGRPARSARGADRHRRVPARPHRRRGAAAAPRAQPRALRAGRGPVRPRLFAHRADRAGMGGDADCQLADAHWRAPSAHGGRPPRAAAVVRRRLLRGGFSHHVRDRLLALQLAGSYDPFGYARRLASRLAAESRAGPALFAYHDTTIHYPGDVAYPFYRAHAGAPLRMWYAVPGSEGSRHDSRAQREQLYDELVSEADAQLGIVLDRLRAEGRYDDAFIVVFSDHGEGFQPGFPDLAGAVPVHGARLSEDENRILLAFKAPAGSGIEIGRTVHQLVRLIDVGPTLLEAAGLRPLANADGVSLLPLLRGGTLPPLRLYAETGYTHVAPDAFDPEHFSGGPRGIDAFQVRGDGAVEMNDRAHSLAMREKDAGALDGTGWLVRAPQADGSVRERCEGTCSAALRTWLASVQTAP